MPARDAPPACGGDGNPPSSLFDFLPIGAYRSSPDGALLRANPALVHFNGFASEAELLAAARDIGRDWYVDPARRAEFIARLEQAGEVRAFVSEVRRYRSGERAWVSENAHRVLDADGRTRCYEGTVEDITERVRTDAERQRNESELREIAARVPGVVYRLHIAPDGRRRFSFVSDGVRELYGVSPQAVLDDGELLRRFDHPDDHGRVAAETLASRHGGHPVHTEFRIVLGDGALKWVQLASSSVASTLPGEVRVGVMIDITARKLAEDGLRDNERRWKQALESTGDGVWDWDIANDRETVSPRLLQSYGLSADGHDGRPETLDALTHPDDRARMLHDRQAHLSGATPVYENEHRVRSGDGRWHWVLSRGVVIDRDAGGRPLRMIGTHTDISARKEAEALRHERDRSAAAQKTQTAFLSRVSHELRTPLNAIIGFAQLLELERVGSERQQVWIHTVLDSGRHLLALVNDLLDLSSAQTGQLQFTRAPVDLKRLLNEAWAMHAADAAAAGLTLVDALPAQPLAVLADPTRLKQVASNLLSNAIKYNRPGGRVTLAAAVDGDGVELTVSDDGQGMDEAQLARLFNPFERVGAQHSTVAGTGLGLALARQLVEAMGGRIGVRSAPARGSAFSVRLPAAHAENAVNTATTANGPAGATDART